MSMQRIADWDDAYSNIAHIPGGEDFIPRWEDDAAAFRKQVICDLDVAYGSGDREKYDLFHPSGPSKGLLFFVHGGYWLRFDKSLWSHFATGALAKDYHVCMPSYPLCPDVEIGDILVSARSALEQCASQVSGPIYLCGHSAGGQIVTMLTCTNHGPVTSVAERIERTVSIAGVHDLRPLLNTELNERLKLTPQKATQWSPALSQPAENADVVCWVGIDERPEFIRQNQLLSNIWIGLGSVTSCVEEAGRHHFDVIDGLRDPHSPLIRAIFKD